jgi:hypothetical protein
MTPDCRALVAEPPFMIPAVSRKRRGAMTAEELLREFEADPEFTRVQAGQDAARRDAERTLRAAEAPLVDDLARAGFAVDSAWDLVNTSDPYPEALPILLRHLQLPYPDRVREGIARALAVRGDAAFAWDTLVDLYRDEPAGTDAKDGLAVALAAGGSTAVLDDLIELLADPRHGQSRILLIKGISRSRSDKARKTLARLVHDPVVGTEVQRLLKRRKS